MQLCGLMLFALCYVHQINYNSATPVSRLNLLHAIISHHQLSIDSYAANTPDKAYYAGHYYSDKAPGTALVALPGFAAAAMIGHVRGIDLESSLGWRITSWAACIVSQALPAACGAAALFAWLRRYVCTRVALWTVLAIMLGGLCLPYSTLLFSHSQVIGLICVAVWAVGLFREDEAWVPSIIRQDSPIEKYYGRMALAGLCLGLALASEFTAGIVVVALGLYVVIRRRSGVVPFVVAAIPPLLLIPAYSWVTIGTPWHLPYSFQASFPAMREGLFAIKWPDAQTAYNLLFSPARGLLYWSPFLALAIGGYADLYRRSPWAFWLMYLVPCVQVLVISGRVWDWQAGNTVGPRYLAPMLPLLALPCALCVKRVPLLGGVLGICAMSLMTIATLTDACPSDLYNPLTELHIPKFLRGEFSYTLGTEVFGLPPWISVGLYYAILIGGIAWLWRLAGEADRQTMPQPLMNPDERG